MRVLVLILIASLLGCKQESFHNEMIVLGHAGEGVDFMHVHSIPNSMESIRAAMEIYELDGIEVDVQFSKDMVPLIFHDKYLDETSNGSGLVYEAYSDYIDSLKYKGRDGLVSDESILKGLDIANYISPMASIPYVSLNVKNYNPNLNLGFAAQILNVLVRDISGYDRVFVESDNSALLDSLRAQEPMLICLKNGRVNEEDYNLITDHGWSGVVCHFSEVEPQWLDSFKAKELLVVTYGQKNQRDMQHQGTTTANVIQVDNPILAQRSR